MAQWKRAGPITQRSVDRNHALLTVLPWGIFLKLVVKGGNVWHFHPKMTFYKRISENDSASKKADVFFSPFIDVKTVRR